MRRSAPGWKRRRGRFKPLLRAGPLGPTNVSNTEQPTSCDRVPKKLTFGGPTIQTDIARGVADAEDGTVPDPAAPL